MNKEQEIKHLKKCIREGMVLLNGLTKQMSKVNLQSITRWSGWINKDANKILDLLNSQLKSKR